MLYTKQTGGLRISSDMLENSLSHMVVSVCVPCLQHSTVSGKYLAFHGVQPGSVLGSINITEPSHSLHSQYHCICFVHLAALTQWIVGILVLNVFPFL